MKYFFFVLITFLSGHLLAADKQRKQFRFIIHNKYENPVVVKYESHGTVINNGSSTLVGPLTMCRIETTGFMPINNLEIKSSSMVFIEKKNNNEIKITQNKQLLGTLTKVPLPAVQLPPDNDMYYRYCVFNILH